MTNATQSPPGVDAGPAAQGRRLNIGGMPAAPLGLALTALVCVVVIVAASGYTLAVARDALRASMLAGAWVDIVAVLLAVVSLVVVLPLVRAFRRCADVR